MNIYWSILLTIIFTCAIVGKCYEGYYLTKLLKKIDKNNDNPNKKSNIIRT